MEQGARPDAYGNLARAFARQAHFALKGRTVEVYDGGQTGRAASIEEGAGRSATELIVNLEDGLTKLEDVWSSLAPRDWELPSTHRGSTLLATQLCWWREINIHYADLDIGYRSDNWSGPLGEHLISFLQSRLPEEGTIILLAGDTGHRWEFGTGAVTTVYGSQNALAAWLAGRPASQIPRVEGYNASIPELGPWP